MQGYTAFDSDVKTHTLIIRVNGESLLGLELDPSAALAKEWEIDQLRLSKLFFVSIGGVPFIVEPFFRFFFGVDIIRIKYDITLKSEITGRLGFSYRRTRTRK
eukprot:139657_1